MSKWCWFLLVLFAGANICYAEGQAQKTDPPLSVFNMALVGRFLGERCVNPKDGAVLVWAPAATFRMGSADADLAPIVRELPFLDAKFFAAEQPRHEVMLNGFWIARTEVTVAQYRAFCAATKRAMPRPPAWGWQETHPVVNVTWEDADAYAVWAGGRLPTEAQWELAARGDKGSLFPWGNAWNAKLCNHRDAGVSRTQPVGCYPDGASPFGALDCAGNAWEWCADWFAPDWYTEKPAANPTGPVAGAERAIRGGGWGDDLRYTRGAARLGQDPGIPSDTLGLRYVIVPAPPHSPETPPAPQPST